jgi:hypothetical protein
MLSAIPFFTTTFKFITNSFKKQTHKKINNFFISLKSLSVEWFSLLPVNSIRVV